MEFFEVRWGVRFHSIKQILDEALEVISGIDLIKLAGLYEGEKNGRREEKLPKVVDRQASSLSGRSLGLVPVC